MLVRFTRTHSDDDELIVMKFGPYPGVAAYFEQLRQELDGGGLETSINLVMGELAIPCVDRDLYFLYCDVAALPNETPQLLVQRLQVVYDEGAVAGWFRVIEGAR